MRRCEEFDGSNAGIVRVFRGRYEGPGTPHAGMGVLAGRRHVLTCAHVVNVALARDREDQSAPHPQAIVHVDFPIASRPSATTARPVAWFEPGFARGDMALLQLEEDAPFETGLAILTRVCGMPTADDQISVFGLPPGNAVGQHIEAKFLANVGGGWAQLDGVGASGAFVVGGFSGGAVWDRTQDGVIGMVVAKDTSPGVRVAYCIPTLALKRFAPAVPVEVRRVFPAFNMTWSALATFLFVMLLLHLLLNRGLDGLSNVIPWAENRQLATLWGMHFFAFLAPFLYGLLLLHATSFRLHQWWQRVPSFLGRGPASAIGNTRISATLSLLFFLRLPLYAQAFFIDQFHDGVVAIDVDRFGYTRQELEAAGRRCMSKGKVMCVHPDAGIYSTVPARGTAEGGYWKDAYRYGDGDLSRLQTFFPLLQPLVIYALSLMALAFAALSVVVIVKPRSTGLDEA